METIPILHIEIIDLSDLTQGHLGLDQKKSCGCGLFSGNCSGGSCGCKLYTGNCGAKK